MLGIHHFRNVKVLFFIILLNTALIADASTVSLKGTSEFEIKKIDRKSYSSIDVYNKLGCIKSIFINSDKLSKDIEIKGYSLEEIHELNIVEKGSISGKSDLYSKERSYPKLISVYKDIYIGNVSIINENGIAKHIINLNINNNSYLILKNISNIKKLNILYSNKNKFEKIFNIKYKPIDISEQKEIIKFEKEIEVIGIFVTRKNNKKDYFMEYEVITPKLMSKKSKEIKEIIRIQLEELEKININGIRFIRIEVNNNNECIETITNMKLNE
jgi:hypothetical protein